MERTVERILIVDDTPENLDVLRGLLVNYKKSIAINGIEALNLAQCNNKPDLILLDIMMPEMDGYETCKKLKEISCTKDIPVIFMTALSETVDKLKGFEIGAVDYITKPFEPEELLKRIETHLKIARLQKELENHNALLEQKVNERTAELQKSNEELIIAKEQAEASDKLKGEFLAQISHEVRTPINIMVSYASLLQSDLTSEADEDIVLGLNSINKAGKRLVRTMDLIIHLSEIQAGSYQPDLIELDLNLDVLSEISFSFKEIAQNKNLDFIMKIETDGSKLIADKFSVTQIFTQLVENAIVYTESGSINIKLQKNADGKLFVEIIDTGIGISEDFLPNIFDAFSQEETGYTRAYDGNGIGLALVKEYCKLNNAIVEVESEKGVGTTVRVIFQK
ncbi:MAG: hybrid sensor histidine kinase/response regulator [Melioribacteraceae bacterium]|nr:hybrid sensor histidine kinase/response regulator [Melioribacteraceae bacterium]